MGARSCLQFRTGRKAWRSAVLMGLFMVVLGVPLHPQGGQADSEPGENGRAIVQAAFELGVEDREALQGMYRARMLMEVRKYGGDGRVTETQEVDYEVVPVDGGTFSRRVRIDGQDLGPGARAEEEEREAAFRERLRRIREGEEEPEEDENAINLNDELIGRYKLTVEGQESLRNRNAYRIAFTPRDGPLPAQRRIDRALNKARGVIWIDQETSQLMRLEFELVERVRMWWGVLGTINRFRGSLDRAPVLEDRWGDIQQESYGDIRFLFWRSR